MRIALLISAFAALAATRAEACSYADWTPGEQQRAYRTFQADDRVRSNFVYLARVTNTVASREVLGTDVTYEPFAVVSGDAPLPASWTTTRICERTGDASRVGQVYVFLVETHAPVGRDIVGSYRSTEIYDPTLRRQVRQAMRRAGNP